MLRTRVKACRTGATSWSLMEESIPANRTGAFASARSYPKGGDGGTGANGGAQGGGGNGGDGGAGGYAGGAGGSSGGGGAR
eukprot:6117435-Prymnesium_polylepis.1